MDITNQIIAAYLETFYSCDNEQLNELRTFAEEKRVPIISKSTETLILNLLKLKKPKHILEIGAAVGYSACCFANACDCHVTTIEADEEAYSIAKSNIRNLGFEDRVEIIQGDAREVLTKMAHQDPLFDVVFIDAAKSHYKVFWDAALPLCQEETLIICDNILMKGMTVSDEYDVGSRYKTSIRKMREFVAYITNLHYAKTCILPIGDGISLSFIDKETMTEASS